MDTLNIVKDQIKESINVKQMLLANEETLSQIVKAAEVCTQAYLNGYKCLFAGNGGSAADAQHLAGELVSKFHFDRPAVSGIALTTDTSIMTAIGNDYGFEYLFSRQVEAHGQRGDVFIGISTSGNSQNVVKAIEKCKEIGITTIALVGANPCKMDCCDVVIKVPSVETPRIQECQTLIGHIICCIVEENIFGHLKKKL